MFSKILGGDQELHCFQQNVKKGQNYLNFSPDLDCYLKTIS